jgi:hypothetical protein
VLFSSTSSLKPAEAWVDLSQAGGKPVQPTHHRHGLAAASCRRNYVDLHTTGDRGVAGQPYRGEELMSHQVARAVLPGDGGGWQVISLRVHADDTALLLAESGPSPTGNFYMAQRIWSKHA